MERQGAQQVFVGVFAATLDPDSRIRAHAEAALATAYRDPGE
jgi:hypothetical protein